MGLHSNATDTHVHTTPPEPGRRRPVATALCALALLVAAPALAQEPTPLAQRLQAAMDSLVASSSLPGMTVGVALPDGTSLGLASGWADTLRHQPMDPSARMLQGSIGKTYFGAVALQLVSEGRLDLDAKVADYLGHEPWFRRIPNAEDITVRQLMSHTSGVVRYELNPAFLEDLTADPLRSWTPEDRLKYLFDQDAPFAAGEGWDYSDTNYILVAMIVERVTGSTAYDEIRRRLLEPLRLRNTVPSDRPDIPGLVQGYAGPENPFGGFSEMVVDGALAINPQFEWGGGGFASTAQDLAVWGRHIHEGRAFPPDLLEEFRTGTPAPLGPQASYGLGVIMMELPAGTAWGHSGYMPGYLSEMYYFPDHRFAVAVQLNTTDRRALPMPPLRIVNALASQVIASLDRQQAPRETPSGTILVANMDDDSVWLLDGASGVVRAKVRTHIAPHEIAVTPDGATAAITNYGDERGPGNLVQRVDVPSGAVVGEFSVEGYQRLHGAAFLSGDSVLALTSERTGEILVVDVADGGILRTLSTGGRASHMLARGGPWIYAANILDGTVSRIDPTGEAPTRAWPAGTRTEGLAATPDGLEAWTGSMDAGTVIGVRGDSGEIVARVTGLAVPYRLAVTPDGRTVVVSDPEAGHLVLIDRAAGTLLDAIDVDQAAADAGLGAEASPQGFTLSPDGRWAFVSCKAIDRVAVVHLGSRTVVRFFETGAGPDGIAFTPVTGR